MASYPINELSQLPASDGYLSHEKKVLEYWKSINVYNYIQNQYETSPDAASDVFMFMDGPPFVSSSNLHSGHISVGNMKDTVLRFNSMHGVRNLNKLGFDTHGLPSENYAMKQLNLKTCADIEKYGVANFNGFCKNMIHECSDSWKPVYDAMGRMCDFNDTYFTMDRNFMESTWHVFSELHKKGLVYKGHKVLAFSTANETPLSDFEASQNYKTIKTNTAYVAFKAVGKDHTYFVAWTSTPWTLPSNVALCVNQNMKYVICETQNGNKYIVAEKSVENLKLDIKSTSDFGMGSDLVGMEYEPLFDYMNFKYHKVLADNYVKESNIGSGIVHISPAHGADDYRVCLENKLIDPKTLDQVCMVNYQGKYKDNMGEYSGVYVFDADKKIIKELKLKGFLVRTYEYSHEYPYCYRSDTPLIYMTAPSFFVEVTKIRERMIELNKKITWTKKEFGEGRFLNRLKQARDWGISRNRYFGTPIPIWQSETGDESVVIGSVQELVEMANLNYTPTDLHLESIGDIIITSKTTGNELRLVRDVFDCWFESGCVMYSQIHYPFENDNYFDDKEFLSLLVIEGSDQINGWFYSLLVIATAISDKPPFETVVCSGIILDEHGEKISKSKGNFENPMDLINELGADTMRLLCLKSPLVNGDSMLFKKSDAKDTFQRLTPYINAVKFFLEHYMNSQTKEDPITIDYLADPDEYGTNDFTLMDLWILEDVYLLRKNVETYMKDYKIDFAVKEIIDFVENLANWYVKFNRDRLKGLCGKTAYKKSLSVLFTVLFDYCVISAPFMPFLSEHIYQHLGALIPDSKYCTVHLEGYPDCERKHNVVESFSQLQKLSKVLRFARDTSKTHLSVRVPIKKCTIYYSDEDVAKRIAELVPMIEDEINCQKFEYVRMENDSMLVYTIKPNFKELGQTYKKSAKTIVDELTKLTKPTLVNLHNGTQDSVTIDLEDTMIVLDKKYFEVVVAVQMDSENENIKNIASDGLMVSIDMTYDEESHNTCQLKNLMAFVQNCRKEMKLNPWNNVTLKYCLEEDSEQFLQLLESGKSDIVKKLGTQFVKSNVLESSKLFLFRLFKSDKDVKVLVSVEVVPDMAKTY